MHQPCLHCFGTVSFSQGSMEQAVSSDLEQMHPPPLPKLPAPLFYQQRRTSARRPSCIYSAFYLLKPFSPQVSCTGLTGISQCFSKQKIKFIIIDLIHTIIWGWGGTICNLAVLSWWIRRFRKEVVSYTVMDTFELESVFVQSSCTLTTYSQTFFGYCTCELTYYL